MSRSVSIMTVVLTLACMPILAQDVLWQADFTQADAGFTTYHKDGGASLQMTDVDGTAVLVATVEGSRALEGPSIVARGLRGGELCSFVAQVRGEGDAWLIANSRNGWLYSPDVVALTGDWQVITLTKPLDIEDTQASISIVTRTVGKMRLEIKSLQALSHPVPLLYDRDVAPIRFEAEEFSTYPEQVVAHGDRAIVEHTSYANLAGIPCPRTSKPLHVFLRVRVPEADGLFTVVSHAGSGGARVSEVRPEPSDEWQWVSGRPVSAAVMGDRIGIRYSGPKDARRPAAVDCVVVTTEPDPGPERLAAARPLSPGGVATFAVSRAQSAPVLDGMPDDACWASAPVLSGFVTPDMHQPSAYATEMRFCYDDENLYWFFRGEEPVLRHELNQIHEFRKNVTERDGGVYQDDSIGLVLDLRPQGAAAYDIFLNALGTVGDSRMDGENLWSSRDSGFDAAVDAVGYIEDGYWSVEARIGFASLGVSAPATGDEWKATVGRIARAGGETSTWNTCHGGMHDPEAFAAMRFVDSAAGVRVEVPDRLQLGANAVTAGFSSGRPAQGYLLMTSLTSEARTTRAMAFAQTAAEPVAAMAQLDIVAEGDVELAYAVVDAVTLEPLLLSPAYSRSVRTSAAEIRLDAPGPFRLYLNGVEIAAGASSSADVPIGAFLQRGMNALGIDLQAGTAAIEISAGTLTVDASGGWRLAPDGVDDFTNPETDPRTWAVAPVSTVDGVARVGDAGGPTRLRRAILWEDTRLWPNSQPAFYVNQNAVQHLTITMQGVVGHLLQDYVCHLAVPEQFEVVGVSGYYGHIDWMPHLTVVPAGEIELEGTTYNHYRIEADKPARRHGSVRILELFNVFIRTDLEPSDDDHLLYYGIEALGGNILEPLRPVALRVLPELNGAQCSELVFQLWGSFYGNMTKLEMQEAGMQTMQQAGINNLVGATGENGPVADRYGIETVAGLNFEGWSIDMRPWIEQHPDTALISKDEAVSEQYVCTSVLLDEAAEYIDQRIQQIIIDRNADHVDWDYESNVLTSYLACFCPRCLSEFRQHAGLSADVELTAEAIEQSHLDGWISFMNLRFAQLAKLFRTCANSATPPAKLSLYSGYQSADTMWRYGVDWRLVGDLQAADHVGCGYGRRYDTVRATVEALQGIPLVCGAILRPYSRSSDELLVPLTRARLLRRLFDSTGGVLVYDRMPIEGRTWQAIADVTRLAAQYEHVFLQGEFAEIPGVPADAEWLGARLVGDTMLVAVMNGTATPKTYTVTLPAAYATAVEFHSDESVTTATELTVDLQPGDAAVYILKE